MNTNLTFHERSERTSKTLRLARVLGEPICRNSAESVRDLYRVSRRVRFVRWVRSI